jgi:ATP-dependent Clp protease ATP-binding subunit ClpA/protein subunit release factor A
MTEQAPEIRRLLAKFAEPFSATAARAPVVYGRDDEIAAVLQGLASPLKGKVVVVGPKRVGKTAVLQMATVALREGVIETLAGHEVWRFAPSSLPGLSLRDGWQMPLDHLMATWSEHPNIILYIDDLPSAAYLGQLSEINLATALLNGLMHARGLCLAEAEENAWRRFSDAYPDYAREFLVVRVGEPGRSAARQITCEAIRNLAGRHAIQVPDGAIDQAIELTTRFDPVRAQPGTSLDLLKDSLAVVTAGGILSAEVVVRRFAEQTGLPSLLLDDAETFDEDSVRALFRSRVLAQEQATEVVVQMLAMLRARVNNPQRPMGVFFFLGPTGVGKTEMARTLAEYLFGHQERLVRFNMADYTQPWQASQLFGDPFAATLNDRRGLFYSRMVGRPFAVIVLDEFEKAERGIYFRFLQLFDEGVFVNANDELLNLRNTIVIVTSNFGAQLVEQGRMGFPSAETIEAREQRVIAETERNFTPEFMNRMDAVCIFHPLTRAVMVDIARREISSLIRRGGLVKRAIDVDIADAVVEHVVEHGFNPRYGARYLKRQIEKTIAYPLARELNRLPATVTGGGLRLFVKGGRVQAAFVPAVAAPMPAPAPGPGLPAETDLRASLPVLAARVEALEEAFGLTDLLAERETTQLEMATMDFWRDAAEARRKLDAYQRASAVIDQLHELRDALTRVERQLEAGRLDRAAQAHAYLAAELPRVEFASFMSGPYDTLGAYLDIGLKSKHTGARAWVRELANMYLGWAKSRRLPASLLGEDANPDGRRARVVVAVAGFGAYGVLQNETGGHRLIQAGKTAGRESLQRFTAEVQVLPEIPEEDLPVLDGLTTATREVQRAGLLIRRLTATASVAGEDGSALALAGDLPPDELLAETVRLFRTQAFARLHALEPRLPAPGGLVRTYARNTRDKGVHDHRTGHRSLKITSVLAGDLQPFLEAALRR